jgi:hypothetical protein
MALFGYKASYKALCGDITEDENTNTWVSELNLR